MQNLWHRRVRRTTLISVGSAACLTGLGMAKLGLIVPGALALVGLSLLWLCRRKRLVIAIPAIVVVGLLVGLWRGGDVLRQVGEYDAFADQKVTMSGVVLQDSAYGKQKQIDFMIDQVRISGRRLPGQVRVTSFDPVEPKQGDTIIATAKAKPGFGNYQLGMYYAKVQVTSHSQSWFGWLRQHFSVAILNVLPEPQASLGLGFLLGIKSQLPDALNDQLKLAGLTHIVVASGYNLTILVRAARRLLARRSKYQATAVAVMLMAGFVGVTGFSPSMVRATLVTSLSLVAWYYGRAIRPVLLLLFSAAVTAGLNPLYIWGDVGWYLSFLAFAGVMLGVPLVQKRLFGKKEAPQLVQILLETLCAEAVTLPLTLFVFGSFSAVALLSNLIVTPLVSLAMIAVFAGGIAGLVWPGVGAWLALPAQWILSYMTSAISWLADIPWAKQSFTVSVVWLVGVYGGLVVLGWLLYRRSGVKVQTVS